MDTFTAAYQQVVSNEQITKVIDGDKWHYVHGGNINKVERKRAVTREYHCSKVTIDLSKPIGDPGRRVVQYADNIEHHEG